MSNRPKISAQNIQINDQDMHCWTSYRVNLPEGVTLADLHEDPALFVGRNLRDDDELYIVSFDRSWCATCRVISAQESRVELSKPQVVWSDRDGRAAIEFDDGTYEGGWDGSTYSFYRKAIGNKPRTKIKGGFANLGAMKSAISKEYGRRI